MQYRLLEITDLYDECVRQIDINNLSFQEAYEKVNNSCYFESDYIHKYLQKDLHLETMLVYYNFRQLQESWDEDENKEPFSILIRQIKAFQPDIILVSSIFSFSKEQIRSIKSELNHSVFFACYHFSWITEQAKDVLPEYDLAFTGSCYWAEMMGKYNKNVHVVRHAFEPSVLEKIPKEERDNKVGFIGSIMIGRSGHTNRIDMFTELYKKHIPFDYYGKIYGSFLGPRSFADHFFHEPLQIADRIITARRLKVICKPSQFGLEYYRCLNQYAVNLNVHAEIAGTGAGNMRMFEVTGIGSCLVTDYREENSLLFEEDQEIVVYRKPREMADKITYLLNHPEEMKRIALNGQKRTIRDYNYKNKAMTMDSYFQEMLKKKSTNI